MLMRAVLDRCKKVIDTSSCLSIHSKECDHPVMLLCVMATSSRVACFALSCSIAMYDEIAWVK